MNKPTRIRLLILFVSATALAAAYHQAKSEAVMLETAQHFLKSLTAEQRSTATIDFHDENRTTWHFVPDGSFESAYGYPRKGLVYKKMNAEQQRLADAFLSSGLSPAGFVKATTIMSLEEILRIQENDTAGRRNVEKYYFSVFGQPAQGGTWGWRVEGHHVSLNYTLKDGKLVSASPTFFGANPHEVQEGSRKGLQALAREEDLARRLMKSLDADQQKQALVAEVAYRDILTRADTRAKLEDQPHGLAVSKMNSQQSATVMELLTEYAHNMPADIAQSRMKAVEQAPKDKIFFAWAGSIEAGQGDYYRVQGPTFLVEYDNTQDNNNHSHSVWRDYEGDFGRDVLALHHRLYDHGLDKAAD